MRPWTFGVDSVLRNHLQKYRFRVSLYMPVYIAVVASCVWDYKGIIYREMVYIYITLTDMTYIIVVLHTPTHITRPTEEDFFSNKAYNYVVRFDSRGRLLKYIFPKEVVHIEEEEEGVEEQEELSNEDENQVYDLVIGSHPILHLINDDDYWSWLNSVEHLRYCYGWSTLISLILKGWIQILILMS